VPSEIQGSCRFLRGRARPATQNLVRFIAGHADRVTVDRLRWGSSRSVRCCPKHGTPIAPSTYYDVLKGEPSRHALRDEELKVDVARVHHENYDPKVRAGGFACRSGCLVL
jgi:hypothetical protein